MSCRPCDDRHALTGEPWEDRDIRHTEDEQPTVSTDGAVSEDPDAEEPEPEDLDGADGAFDRWRRESALGAVGTGVARGLQAVFAPPVDEPAIVASVPGEPPDADSRVRVILDPDDPAKSIAIIPESPPGSDSG